MRHVSKKLISLLTAATMLLSLTAPALAAGTEAGEDEIVTRAGLEEQLGGDYVLEAGDAADELTHEQVVSALLRWAGMKDSQLGEYPRDYNAMADSMGMDAEIEDYDPQALCTQADLESMMDEAQTLYDALHDPDGKKPLFMNGMAQPIFEYSDPTQDNDMDGDGVVRYCVYVETDYDTDGDGELDLVKALVQIPREAMNSDGGFATIYEARPYITGCISMNPGDNLGDEGYDLESMYAQPAQRTPAGTATTEEAVEAADADDWYYYNPYEYMYDYEDLTWYDYYLVRGFAVVECGGLGTLGSDGFETCGSDLEIDAFKCVIEWLTGDRVAYTDRTSNIAIEANWSNGNVGMTGRSYAGTTQFGLATTGVEGLKTIVPVAGIASWYEYTNSQGISTNSSVSYSESLAWYCNGRYLDQEDFATIAEDYGNYLYQIQQDQEALNGDYGPHWENRDYTLDWANIQCPALIVHGLNDDNVRTKEFELMYQAYQKAGVDVKLLLHQGHHITPTYPAGGVEMYIGDELYDEILNQWFSHYLYDLDNGIEDMAAVTVQSNQDAEEWTTYDSWETAYDMVLQADAAADTTTIDSDYSSAGVNWWNWEDALTTGSSSTNAMYVTDVDEDVVIQGTVAVNFQAATSNVETESAPRGDSAASVRSAASTLDLSALDHDNFVNPNLWSDTNAAPLTETDDTLADRDALMVSAMLVDIAPEGETFPAFRNNNVTETVLEEDGAWMGGGVDNFDLMILSPEDVSYKIIARGWMDLCNPGAGFDSATASADSKVNLEEGKYYDYTIYLQPNVYTVEEGHRLALVIYTYEPGSASYSQNYAVTLDNSSVSATIPVHDSTSAGTVRARYVPGDLADLEDEDTLAISVSGPANAGQDVRAPYLFTMTGDTSELKTMRLSVNVKGSTEDLFEGRQFQALGNFTYLTESVVEEADGSVTHNVVLSYNLSPVEALSEAEEIMELFVRTAANGEGDLTVTLTGVEFNSGVTGAISDTAASVTTHVGNAYDLNGDGVVDLDDIAAAQGYYQMTSADAGWDEGAGRADVNGDGVVNLEDLVAIANVYLDGLQASADAAD